MSTLRYRRDLTKRLTFVLALLLILFFLLGYQLITTLSSPYTYLSFVCIVAFIMFSVFVSFIFYAVVVSRSYHINFTETFFETSGRHPLFQKRFKCAYDHISLVEKVPGNQVRILSRTGEQLFLVPGLFEGGEDDFFNVLERHIPAEKFELNFRNGNKKPSYKPSILTFISFALVLFGLAMMLFQSPSFVFWPLGWNMVGNSTIFYRIVGASVSADSIWVAKREAFGENVFVEHISGNQTQAWYIPGDDFAQRILVDSHQQPVLVADENIYFLKGGEWQKYNYRDGSSILINRIDSFTGVSDEHWMPLLFDTAGNATNSFIKITADHPQPQSVILLHPITQKQLVPEEVEIMSDGTVLLLDDAVIYLLRNGKIESQQYTISNPKMTRISDFTLAADGSVYVLFSDGFQRGNQHLVERIDTQGNHSLTELPLPHVENENYPAYEAIEVDSRGRLWLAGDYPVFISVIESNWGSEGREIVTYDVYNSNYENSYLRVNLLRTLDGRIWVADDNLIWMDSNLAQLPTPLPNWLAAIRNRVGWPGFIFPTLNLIGILLANGGYWLAWWREKRQRQSKK